MCGGSGSPCIEELVAPCPSCSTRPRTHSLPAHRGGVGSGVGNAVSTTVMRNAREVLTSTRLPAAQESRPRFVAMFSGCIDEASSSYGWSPTWRRGADERCGGGRWEMCPATRMPDT